MKKLFVEQRFNPDYQGPDFTPHVKKYVYFVKRVMDSLTPGVNDVLTADELQEYCDSEHWTVTVS